MKTIIPLIPGRADLRPPHSATPGNWRQRLKSFVRGYWRTPFGAEVLADRIARSSHPRVRI